MSFFPVKKRRPAAGFTLIEIMVVMAIIGILAVISVGSYRSTQVKARDAQRKSDLKQIKNSLEVYFNDKGEYPSSSAEHELNGCATKTTCAWGEAWQDENDTIYMIKLPADPKDYLAYYYESDGTYFQIYARLENDLDYDVPIVEGEPGNYNISCGDDHCNYGVASTNAAVEAGRSVVAD